MLLFAPYLMFFFSGNVTNFPAVLQPPSTCQWFRLLTVCCQRFTNQPIVFCVVRPTLNSLALAKRAVSLFSSRAAALVSRVSRLRRSRACIAPTKSEEKERLLAVYSMQYLKILLCRYYIYWYNRITQKCWCRAGAHILNCRQPFVSHTIQFSGVEKGDVANGHNKNNSNY